MYYMYQFFCIKPSYQCHKYNHILEWIFRIDKVNLCSFNWCRFCRGKRPEYESEWIYETKWLNIYLYWIVWQQDNLWTTQWLSLLVRSNQVLVRDNGPLTRYAKLRVAHAPGMPATVPRHRELPIPTCITVCAWRTCRDACAFLWNRWWRKRSRHSRQMRHPQFCISGKRPMGRQLTSNSIAWAQTMHWLCGPICIEDTWTLLVAG